VTTDAPVAGKQKLGGLIVAWLLFVVIETTTQSLFKIAGEALDDRAGLGALVQHAVANPLVWAAFASYFCGFLVYMTILKDIDLGRAFPMTAGMYVTTLAAAVILFHEHLTALRILGVLAILGGVGLLASDKNSPAGPALQA
jgi:drug/metabolite transporter (DMT)-like permease